eukprot:2037763-Amphidinium_carterae.1
MNNNTGALWQMSEVIPKLVPQLKKALGFCCLSQDTDSANKHTSMNSQQLKINHEERADTFRWGQTLE